MASRQELIWTDNTAYGCNFTINEDLKTLNLEKEKCKTTCVNTYGCSHYVWHNYKNGTCILKKNEVSEKSVIFSNDPTSTCGLVEGILNL